MVVELQHRRDLDQLIEKSKSDPVVIFKHSTQCAVSHQAYDEFNRFASRSEDVTCGVVLVIEDRAISETIASELGVRHQSPQAIVVRNGCSAWNASHWSITEDSLNEALHNA